MPPQTTHASTQRLRKAILKAKKITAMLQGTMGLEGQALDGGTLRVLTKRSARDILAHQR